MKKTTIIALACLLRTTNYQSCICVDNETLSNNNSNYRWDEKTARDNIHDEIRNKFGSVSSSWWLWPFMSESEKNNIRIKNQEIKEVKDLGEKEIESPDNYKRVVVTQPYISYQTRTVRKPFKKVITEWREVRETVPYTDFRVERKKRWSQERLTSRFKSAIIAYFKTKSYEYALNKTNNRVIADIVKMRYHNKLLII